MGTEGYHEDRRVPWGQRIPYRGETEGTIPWGHRDTLPWGQRGTLPWGQRGTMGTEGYLTMGTEGTLDSVDTSGNTTDAERVTWNHSSS